MSSILTPNPKGYPVLLPDKHLRISECVLGLAGLVLAHIVRPTRFDALWAKVREKMGSPEWPAVHGVENFVLALCFLFSIGLIEVSSDGEIFRCD